MDKHRKVVIEHVKKGYIEYPFLYVTDGEISVSYAYPNLIPEHIKGKVVELYRNVEVMR